MGCELKREEGSMTWMSLWTSFCKIMVWSLWRAEPVLVELGEFMEWTVLECPSSLLRGIPAILGSIRMVGQEGDGCWAEDNVDMH